MFILDDNNTLVDSEFSLDLLDDSPCVIVESSGGANPSRGVTRRNPDYNKLVGLLLQRLAVTNTRITAVVLDSSRVAHVPVTDRTATFDQPYPIDLSTVDIDEFRRTLGRATSSARVLALSQFSRLQFPALAAIVRRLRSLMDVPVDLLKSPPIIETIQNLLKSQRTPLPHFSSLRKGRLCDSD